jgi:hypothetical protein
MDLVVAYYDPELRGRRWAIRSAIQGGVAYYLRLVDGTKMDAEEVRVELVERAESEPEDDLFLLIEADHTDRRQEHLAGLAVNIKGTLGDRLAGLRISMRFGLVRDTVWASPKG